MARVYDAHDANDGRDRVHLRFLGAPSFVSLGEVSCQVARFSPTVKLSLSLFCVAGDLLRIALRFVLWIVLELDREEGVQFHARRHRHDCG